MAQMWGPRPMGGPPMGGDPMCMNGNGLAFGFDGFGGVSHGIKRIWFGDWAFGASPNSRSSSEVQNQRKGLHTGACRPLSHLSRRSPGQRWCATQVSHLEASGITPIAGNELLLNSSACFAKTYCHFCRRVYSE